MYFCIYCEFSYPWNVNFTKCPKIKGSDYKWNHSYCSLFQNWNFFSWFLSTKTCLLSSVRNIWVPKFEKQDDILNENMLCHLPTLYWSNRESCCQDNNILSIESLIFLHNFHYFDIIQIEGELYNFFVHFLRRRGYWT